MHLRFFKGSGLAVGRCQIPGGNRLLVPFKFKSFLLGTELISSSGLSVDLECNRVCGLVLFSCFEDTSFYKIWLLLSMNQTHH